MAQSNTNITINNVNFEENVTDLRAFFSGQDRWKGYDFEGGNLALLIDLLAYNTMKHGFYYNMVANESHLDSAQLRESAVSRAKELNYIPQSFKSAEANVNIDIVSSDLARSSVVIAKGTPFSARIDARNYVFTTGQTYVATTSATSANTQTFTAYDVILHEGLYQTESFVYAADQKYILSSPRIDVSSITVTVIEDDGAEVHAYKRAFSLFDIDDTSKIFFVQGVAADQYEIIFGDGIFGRQPKTNSLVSVEYRTSNGELPNGARKFTSVGSIDGETSVVVSTNEPAHSGSVHESVEGIKYNAPRHFTTQERAVTAEDYESLMKINFPEVIDVSAFGGETVTPPQYGKVFVSVVLNGIDSLPEGKKSDYTKFLKARSMLAIDPVFIDPAVIYLDVETTVKYNINQTSMNFNDISSRVLAGIDQFNTDSLNGFNREFRYSNFVTAIDDSHDSIVSNETSIKLIKRFTYTGQVQQTLDFGVPLKVPTSIKDRTITSSQFKFNGGTTFLADDGTGKVYLVAGTGNSTKTVAEVGVVDYETGIVQLNNLFSEVQNQSLKVYAASRSLNIPAANHSIVRINSNDVKISVQQVRI